MTQQQSTTNWGKGEEPFGQKQLAVAGTSADGKERRMGEGNGAGIWRGDWRIENNGNSPSPIPVDKVADSIFVPFLLQIGTTKGRIAEKEGKRKRKEETMEKCRINRRAFGLIVLLSFLLFSGTFALFDSLLDDLGEERLNMGNENGELTDNDVKNYLNQFGYIEGSERVMTDQPAGVFAQQKHRTADELLGDFSLDSLRSAIQRFQEFAGLPKTGELDNRTRKKMKQPRCGMQDVEMMSIAGGGLKWRKRQLTYRIDHFTADLPNYMQKKALKMAFDAWSREIPLYFSETTENQADIRVRFARGSHGDPWSFDGKGGVLAHATFPSDGQLHFDDDEQWAFMDAAKISSFRYTDLFWVSLHEIGHILGLSHSKIETAIMAPFYRDPDEMVDWRGNYKTPGLTYADIRAAQQIYGKRNKGGTNGGKGNYYDDNEGGFLKELGKFFGGSEDGAEDEQIEWERGERHWGRNGNADHSSYGGSKKWGHRRNEEEGEEKEEGIFGKYFSASSRPFQQIIILAFSIILSLLILFQIYIPL